MDNQSESVAVGTLLAFGSCWTQVDCGVTGFRNEKNDLNIGKIFFVALV